MDIVDVPATSVGDAIAALDAQLVKQLKLIAKASAACAIEDDRDQGGASASSSDDATADGWAVPASVADLRAQRHVRTPTSTSAPREASSTASPQPAPKPAHDTREAAVMTEQDSRVQQLEAEVAAMKQKHQRQLIQNQRDLLRMQKKLEAQQGGGSDASTPASA